MRNREGAELARFLTFTTTVILFVAMVIFCGGDGDGGTGPRPADPPVEPAPSIIPDRPPAAWFTEYAK